MNRIARFKDLGLIGYQDATKYQEKIFREIVENKLRNQKLPENKKVVLPNHLLFCEHPHVYTLGKSGSVNNLLINTLQLKQIDAEFFRTNRGGDITYHGPGQIVGYPVFDLDFFGLSLKEYIDRLEEAVILTLQHFSIGAERLKGATGVWLDIHDKTNISKICAIGVRSSHWVTMHGFAFNVNTDLSYFGYINPCGYTDKVVTSLEKELGKKQDISHVKSILLSELSEVFGFML